MYKNYENKERHNMYKLCKINLDRYSRQWINGEEVSWCRRNKLFCYHRPRWRQRCGALYKRGMLPTLCVKKYVELPGSN